MTNDWKWRKLISYIQSHAYCPNCGNEYDIHREFSDDGSTFVEKQEHCMKTGRRAIIKHSGITMESFMRMCTCCFYSEFVSYDSEHNEVIQIDQKKVSKEDQFLQEKIGTCFGFMWAPLVEAHNSKVAESIDLYISKMCEEENNDD